LGIPGPGVEVTRLGGVAVVSTVDPAKDVRAGRILDAVSWLGVSDWLSEADSGSVWVGAAEAAELDAGAEAGGDAVGKALSVEMVKVGKSCCAATLERPRVVIAASRKRADGDMRLDIVERMVVTLSNLLNRLDCRGRGLESNLLTRPAVRSRKMRSHGLVYLDKLWMVKNLKVACPLLVGT
jgi:hypothetical protein